MYEKKFFFKTFILLIICFFIKEVVYAQSKDKVLILGDSGKLSGLVNKLKSDFDVAFVNAATDIEANNFKLLILASENTVDEAYRFPVHQFLQKGGNVIFIGKETFNYDPDFYNGSLLTDLKKDFEVVWPKRDFTIASVDKPEIKTYECATCKTISFETKNRGMRDVLLGLKIKNKTSKLKNTLNFRAKGSHFMDLLALEIKDTKGKKWYSFLPVTPEWETYSVSLANFIPENWNNTNQAYPLLDPTTADSLYIGLNSSTVWKEKAMGFTLGDIKIGENKKNIYQPSSLLKTLRYPFQAIGIKYPEWIIDPFFNSRKLHQVNLVTKGNFISQVSIPSPFTEVYALPEFFYEHPVSTSGTDTKKAYDNKENRVSRREQLLVDKTSGMVVAEFIQFANGPYKLASISSLGVNISDIQVKAGISDLIVNLSKEVVGKPRIINVAVNTTEKKDNNSIYPLFKVNIQNVKNQIVKGKIELFINNQVTNALDVALVPNVNKQYSLELKSLPTDFSLKTFVWKVRFTTTNSVDELTDTVDVEKAMLASFKFLTDAQKFYPDGRFSNHYFGDAYGVRAMFAYLDYLKQNPQTKYKYSDMWTNFTESDIKNSAESFYDMLVNRQASFGAYPMGYSEHAGGYNVADGGQMALSMMQSSGYISDANRKNSYINSVVKFGNWAEEYYITPELSAQLKISHPEEYKKGQTLAGLYGLGLAGKRKQQTGPSWVLADIIAAQILLSKQANTIAAKNTFKVIAERNSRFYVESNYDAVGYYQAEALFWIYLTTKEQDLKKMIANNLKETFVQPLLKGVENDMFLLGGRATLKALPLIYYQRYIEDNEDIRAVLFKYVWNFAAEHGSNSIFNSAKCFPKAVHGESLTASKYAALSSLWAMELINPGSSLISF